MSTLIERVMAGLRTLLGKTEEEAQEIAGEGKVILEEVEKFIIEKFTALESRITSLEGDIRGEASSSTAAPHVLLAGSPAGDSASQGAVDTAKLTHS